MSAAHIHRLDARLAPLPVGSVEPQRIRDDAVPELDVTQRRSEEIP